jgi:hypothetical protein
VQRTTEQIRQIVRSDLDPDFVESVAIALAWNYRILFDRLSESYSLGSGYLNEIFNKSRGDCAVRALEQAARQHGVPFEFKRLEGNGQSKLLVKAGRLIIIQETIDSLTDHPDIADYKLALADLHGFVQQLELDLGDQPRRIRDWSGCVLGVLLHGAAGYKFTTAHKTLGSVMLGIPDAAYRQWIVRLDFHEIAMFGRGHSHQDDSAGLRTERIMQEDKVLVTPKKRNTAEGAI